MLEENHENSHTLQRLKAADLSAFNALYDKYRKALFIYALQYIEDEQVCYELVHDAFIYVWQKRSDSLRDPKISSYLFTFIKSRALNHLRGNSGKVMSELSDFAEPSEHPNYELDPLPGTGHFLNEALSAIPSAMILTRRIFEMRFIREMSYKDIADSTAIKVNTVYVHINYAVSILKRKFKKT